MMANTILLVTACVLSFHAVFSHDKITDNRCPLGFIPFKNSCYWFSHIKATFPEAGYVCLYMKGHLVEIKNREVNDYIKGHLTRHGKGPYYYIGATDLRLEGRFTWEGETAPIQYSDWSSHSPNNHGGNQQCVVLEKAAAYQWNDWLCDQSLQFICEI